MGTDSNPPRRGSTRQAVSRPILAALLAAAATFNACDNAAAKPGSAEEPPQVVVTDADREAAKAKFDTLCYTCHGNSGAGDGPASVGLVPTPRNFQDPDWQASVTDEHIEKIIVGGGAAVGKAITMPSNPDLKGKPAVVAALREYIRGLAPQ